MFFSFNQRILLIKYNWWLQCFLSQTILLLLNWRLCFLSQTIPLLFNWRLCFLSQTIPLLFNWRLCFLSQTILFLFNWRLCFLSQTIPLLFNWRLCFLSQTILLLFNRRLLESHQTSCFLPHQDGRHTGCMGHHLQTKQPHTYAAGKRRSYWPYYVSCDLRGSRTGDQLEVPKIIIIIWVVVASGFVSINRRFWLLGWRSCRSTHLDLLSLVEHLSLILDSSTLLVHLKSVLIHHLKPSISMDSFAGFSQFALHCPPCLSPFCLDNVTELFQVFIIYCKCHQDISSCLLRALSDIKDKERLHGLGYVTNLSSVFD